MDWYQLMYFKTLAKVENITKAANELSLTQSALSRSIARLEDELGVQLFDRNIRGVKLNRYGKIFLQHVDRAIQEISLAKQVLQDMVDPFKGTISIAFIHTLGSNFVPNVLGAFKEKYPDVRFQLTQDTTQKIIQQMELGEVDLGFCSPNKEMENVSAVPVIDEELFLAVPKSHRLANKKEVNLSEVNSDPFVMYKPESGVREIIENLCKEAGFQPTVSFEGVGDETIAGLVAANFGVALIPMTPGMNTQKISLLRVKHPRCRRVIHMVWRTDRYISPAVLHFKKFVEDNVKDRKPYEQTS